MRSLPIGVFDSGIGGLTVLKKLLKELPKERFMYFGDTARLPYGTKSPETVLRYSKEIARFLLYGSDDGGRRNLRRQKPRIKMIVVACNTASAVAADALRREFPVPVVGVVEAGARQAAWSAPKGTVAVIGTKATVSSSIYAKRIQRLAPKARIISRACPLFVPLVEEGWRSHPVTQKVARIYLEPIRRRKPDVLILGCTHYPMVLNVIRKVMPRRTVIVDSPTAVARSVKDELARLRLHAPQRLLRGGPKVRFFASDDPRGFKRSARMFLGKSISAKVKLVRLTG